MKLARIGCTVIGRLSHSNVGHRCSHARPCSLKCVSRQSFELQLVSEQLPAACLKTSSFPIVTIDHGMYSCMMQVCMSQTAWLVCFLYDLSVGCGSALYSVHSLPLYEKRAELLTPTSQLWMSRAWHSLPSYDTCQKRTQHLHCGMTTFEAGRAGQGYCMCQAPHR